MSNVRPPAIAAALLACLLLSGCASVQMKGTPFYSGEYEVREGPASERINLWPALYYREPALSALWPLFELTEDHAALRPLASVYGLDTESKVVNVLWPIAQFNRQTGRNRVFPAFWGEDYRVVFPLYWHSGSPLGPEGGHDALIPLWSFRRDAKGYTTDLLWPLIRFQERDDRTAWHVLPLAGSHDTGQGYYRFLLWPIGHQWGDHAGTRGGHAVFPLYGKHNGPDGTFLVSLPYSRLRREDGTGWTLVPPLAFHSRQHDRTALFTPLYSRSVKRPGSEGWSLLLPFYYHGWAEDSRTVATLLGGLRRDGNERTWAALPILGGGRSRADGGEFWAAGPLLHARWSPDARSHHAFPFYYRSVDGARSVFVSPVWARGTTPSGQTFRALPPVVSFVVRGEDGTDLWALGGLAHFRWGERSGPQHVLPFAYWNDETGTFLSMPLAKWRGESGSTVLVPPALSWMRTADARRDLWVLGPLAHWSWGEDAGSSHLFPVYYGNPAKKTAVSPLFARWQGDDATTYRALPLLLSGSATRGDELRVGALLGLFYNEWDKHGAREGHLLPLYHYERDRAFYTPLVGWNKDRRNGFVYPLTPLVGIRRGEHTGGWLFPLLSWKKHSETGDRKATFLWGGIRKTDRETKSGFLPLYDYRSLGSIDDIPADAPLNSVYGKRFFCLPVCWYRNQVRTVADAEAWSRGDRNKTTRNHLRRNGAFPLWSYRRDEWPEKKRTDVESSCLLLLFDYLRRSQPAEEDASATDEYVRSRVLWRMWHYERANDDVSVDVFPSITYDRRGQDFKKVSFLWRLFRYERDEDSRKLDLLFLPIVRRGGE